MSEEDPTEHVQEHIQHTVLHGDHDEHGEHAEHGDAHAPHPGHPDHAHHASHASRWITAAALTAAFLAAFAAVSGALATSHLTQSTLIRIKANDDWSYYQAKSIKMSILDGKIYSAKLAHVPPRDEDSVEQSKYKGQLPKIQSDAEDLEKLSDRHLETHESYEGAETLFHIAIAIVAIAVVAKRKEFWFVSIVGGAIGVVLFAKAAYFAPPPFKEEPPAATAPAHPASTQSKGEHASSGEHAAPGEHAGSPGHAAKGEHRAAADGPTSEPAP